MATRAAKLALRGKALTDTGTEIGIVNNADATAITIDASENVGIGTTSPITKLDASQDNIGGNVAFGIFQSGNAYGNVASSASLYLGATYHSLANSAKITSTHSSGTTGDHAQDLTFNPINSGSTSFEAMRISSAGNVGIGSSSPVRQLEIKDDGTRGQAIVGIIADAGDPAGIFMGTTSNNNVGGIRYFTDTNKLALRANDEDRLLIDSAGIVTKPYQPAFSAVANTQNNMGINAWLQIAFANQRFDQNQDYAANTFTAPVTGKYQLQVSVRLDNIDTSTQYYQVRIRTSNRNYHSICDFDGMSTDPSYWNFNNSVLADMDAGDTCVVEFLQASGNSQTDINDESYFNGYLVC